MTASRLSCRTAFTRRRGRLHKQSVLGLGVSFRPQARVDFESRCSLGWGLAPSAVLIRAIVLSVGKTYQGRAVTPIAELAADVTVEFARWIKISSRRSTRTSNKTASCTTTSTKPVMSLGALAPDGSRASMTGSVPVGRTSSGTRHTRLCNDEALTDCFLHRTSARSEWQPVHRCSCRTTASRTGRASRGCVSARQPQTEVAARTEARHPIGHELKQDRPRFFLLLRRARQAPNQTLRRSGA